MRFATWPIPACAAVSVEGASMKTTRALLLGLLCIALAVPAAVVAQDKPRYGGILNWFDYGDPGRLDVHAESPLVVQQATAGVYSGLLHWDPDDPSKIAGDLAERWTVSPDGKTYTFHLRTRVGVVSRGRQARAREVRRPQSPGGPDRNRSLPVPEVRPGRGYRVGE